MSSFGNMTKDDNHFEENKTIEIKIRKKNLFFNVVICQFFYRKQKYMYIRNQLVGRVGYAPTTPAMSMQYSTIELTAQ